MGMASEEIKRRVQHAKEQMEKHSKLLEAQHRSWSESRKLFPSTMPGGREFLSPLGGEAQWPWGRKKERS
jgi:hypothetical protein